MKENQSASAASPPEADAARPAPAHAGALDFLLRQFRRNEGGLILAILVVVALTTLLDTQHTYWLDPWPSAWNILRQAAPLGIFALGAAIVIISGGIDLSCGSVIAFSGSFCASLMILLARQETQVGIGVIVVAIGGTLMMGLLIGSFHAWLITVLGLPPFVATLATLVGLRSLARVMVENVTQQVLGHRTTQIQIFDRVGNSVCVAENYIFKIEPALRRGHRNGIGGVIDGWLQIQNPENFRCGGDRSLHDDVDFAERFNRLVEDKNPRDQPKESSRA